MDSMASAKSSGLEAIAQGETDFNLAPMTDVDSSAIALLLAWRRAARVRKTKLKLEGAAPAVLELASVYEVTDLLELQTAG
jgi:phospholipid transport system transporter-binding protein